MRLSSLIAIFCFTLIFLSNAFAGTLPTEKVGDTTKLAFAGKEIALTPEIKEMVFSFKDLTPTIAKFDLAFNSGEKTETFISFASKEKCVIETKQAICGMTLYNFNDMNDYKIKLTVVENGFELAILELKENTDYFIDPFIDANFFGSLSSGGGTYQAIWLANTFYSNYTGIITAVQLELAKLGNSSGFNDLNVAIWSTNASHRPLALLDSNCVTTISKALPPGWAAHSLLDANFSNNCNVVADTNYAIVINNAGAGSLSDHWMWAMTYTIRWDKNAMKSTDSGINWNVAPEDGGAYGIFWFNEWITGQTIPNNAPIMTSVSRSPLGNLVVGQTITITPNDLNDLDKNKLSFYCDENATPPSPTENLCSEGDQNYTYPYTGAQCSYFVPAGASTRTVACRAFDGQDFSADYNVNYNISTSYLKIGFVNEKTGAGTAMNTSELTIDGNGWATDANGLLTISNLNPITSGFHEISANLSGYGVRYWDLNFGIDNGGDYNFGMRATDANSGIIPFKYYAANGTTVLANTRLTVYFFGTTLVSGIRSTSASGDVNFFLDAGSQKYRISSSSLDYDALILTIKVPKDEVSSVTLTPFQANVLNVFSFDVNAYSSDANVYIYSNTSAPYTVTVEDTNDLYTAKQYSVIGKGTGAVYVLQPTLLLKTVGSSVTIFVRDSATGISLPNTAIVIKKYIGGVLVVTESKSTDSSGAATFSMVYNDDYYIDASYGSLSILNQLLRPIVSQYTIRFNASTSIGTVVPSLVGGITIAYSPSSVVVDYNSTGHIVFGTVITSQSSNISKVIFTLTQDSNSIYSVTQTNGGIPFMQYTVPIPIIDVNSTVLTNGKPFDFNIFIQTTDGNVGYYYHSISYSHNKSHLDVFSLLEQVPANTDDTFMAFVSLFLTLIIVGLAIAMTGNSPSISILGGVCFLFFGFLGWMPIAISIVACIGGFAFYYLRSGF